MCPGSRISGGKVLSSKTRKVVNHAATALRVAAQSVTSSKSAIGTFYRRKKAQLGVPKDYCYRSQACSYFLASMEIWRS